MLDESEAESRREHDRHLGPEMEAQGWRVVGGDWLMWCHEPSHRVVTVEGPCPRETKTYVTTAIPAYHGEPLDPATQGYLVLCRVHDEGGNPVSGHGFWVESYGEALRRAQAIREAVLAERPAPLAWDTQLTFDDVLR